MKNISENIENIYLSINKIIFSYGESVSLPAALALIAVSVLLLFWGYKIKKLTLIIIGFLFGAFLGLAVSDIFDLTKPNELFVFFASGFIFAAIIYFLYFAVIALAGFSLGVYLGVFLSKIIKSEVPVTIIIILCIGFIIAYILCKIDKIAFIFITAFLGFLLFRISFISFEIISNKNIELIISFLLLITGVVYQIYDNYHIYREKAADNGNNKPA